VTAAAGTPGIVRVYWRPGCPFCTMLRLGLHRARLPVEEINIWADPAAAAQVRAITGGDETVPTVVVGTRAMVNPSARQVIAAVRAGQPGVLPAPETRTGSWLARAAGFLPRRRLRRGHAADERSGHTPG
jgi:mycoredoxin